MVVGVLLACTPFVAFDLWLGGRVEREARAEVALIAKRAIDLIDARLGRATAKLESLVADGVTSCSPAHVEALLAATFATSPVKEFSILGLDGQTSCTDSGLAVGPRRVVGRPYKTDGRDTFVEIVYFADLKRNMVRIRRVLDNGDAIAALLAPDIVFPTDATSPAGALHARIHGADGTLIADINSAAVGQTPVQDLFTATAESGNFGVRATIMRTRAQALAANEDAHTNGLIFSSAAASVIFGITMLLMQRRRQAPHEKLAAAVAAGEFVPYYQPIVDITTGRLVGAEVLARWRRPDGSLGMPGTFIPLMEENRLINELNRSLMRQACADLAGPYGRCPNIRVSFNLTAEQFEDEATVVEVRSIFYGSPIKLSQIVLELTERQEPRSFKKTRQVIAALQVLGCKVALDDVGTGHSGLSAILKLGVDIIKIDKMFVDSMDDDRNSAAIIATLVELARKLGMDTVAEGVEHFDQVVELRRRGIRAAQGFVFAPALPASAYVQLIDALDPPEQVDASRLLPAVA